MQREVCARIDEELHRLGGCDLLQHYALRVGADAYQDGFLSLIAQQPHDVERVLDQLVFADRGVAKRKQFSAERVAHVVAFAEQVTAFLKQTGDPENAVCRQFELLGDLAHPHAVRMRGEELKYGEGAGQGRNLEGFRVGLIFRCLHFNT